ncbi:glycosyltransferase family 4 protein [Dongia sp.]|uniref:glycosyltransferase family 4 protein n=1 Tax=Dongia sp. TaxID=1977262 RepID=UPI003752C18C
MVAGTGSPPQTARLQSGRRALSVCIVAYKDLTSNTRVARQAHALAARGHAVTVVSFAPPDPRLVGDRADFAATGVPKVGAALAVAVALAGSILGQAAGGPVRLAAALGGRFGQLRCQQFGLQAAKLCRGRRFDVVQAHFDKALIAAAAIREQCGGRLVFDAVELPFDRDSLPAPADQRALRLAEIAREQEIARTADQWLTVGGTLAAEITRRFRIAAPLVVRNCRQPHLAPDARIRRDLGLDGAAQLVLALNSVRAGEGVEVIVEALRHLPAHVHLAILGQGTDGAGGERLRSIAAAAGAGGRLHLPPLQPASEVIGYASGADMGIIPRQPVTDNLSLSLPNRFFEMVAAGLPLAVSRVGEIAALVDHHGIGVVFDENNPRAAAAAIAEVLDLLRQGDLKARVLAAAHQLSWDREQIAYVELIESLGQQENRRG